MAETPISISKEEVPRSFGVLKPVGHVVVGFADHQDREDARAELRRRGFADADIVAIDAVEMKAQLDRQLGEASGVAGFGYEIVLANFYRELAAVGHEWLIVRAGNDGLSQQVADVARGHHAELADRYGTLVIEQMLTPSTPH